MKVYSKLHKMYKKAWYGWLYGSTHKGQYHIPWLLYLELKTYDKPPSLQNTLS